MHQWSCKMQLGPQNRQFTSSNDNFQYSYPLLIYFFIFFPFKTFYCLLKPSGVSVIKPDVSQGKAMLRNDVRFPTTYCRMYRCKILTSSNQTLRYIRKCIRIWFYHTGRVKRICVLEHSVMTNFNCACPVIRRGQGSGFLSEGSSWLTACMSEQRRFWRDCADAQARLNLRCSHRW